MGVAIGRSPVRWQQGIDLVWLGAPQVLDDGPQVAFHVPTADATTSSYDPNSLPYSGSYHGGYVAYSNWFADEKRIDSFILEPTQ